MASTDSGVRSGPNGRRASSTTSTIGPGRCPSSCTGGSSKTTCRTCRPRRRASMRASRPGLPARHGHDGARARAGDLSSHLKRHALVWRSMVDRFDWLKWLSCRAPGASRLALRRRVVPPANAAARSIGTDSSTMRGAGRSTPRPRRARALCADAPARRTGRRDGARRAPAGVRRRGAHRTVMAIDRAIERRPSIGAIATRAGSLTSSRIARRDGSLMPGAWLVPVCGLTSCCRVAAGRLTRGRRPPHSIDVCCRLGDPHAIGRRLVWLSVDGLALGPS